VCPARSECPVQSATHSESLVQSHSLIPDNPRPSRVHPNRVVRPLYCQKVSVTPLRLTVCNRKKKEVKKEEGERRKEKKAVTQATLALSVTSAHQPPWPVNFDLFLTSSAGR
jgi:hypothetical protein